MAIESPLVAALWHRRLGHLSNHSVKFMGQTPGIAKGIPLMPESTKICESCQEGKQSRERIIKHTHRRATVPFALVHSDLCGIIHPTSLGGAHYF